MEFNPDFLIIQIFAFLCALFVSLSIRSAIKIFKSKSTDWFDYLVLATWMGNIFTSGLLVVLATLKFLVVSQ